MTKAQEDIALLKEKYIQYYTELPVQKYAAMSIGRNEDTIIRWCKDDAYFADQVQIARANWVKSKAKKVRPEFSLERLEKDIWAERKEVRADIGINVAREVLEGAGIVEGDRQTNSDTQGTPEGQTQV